MNSHIFNHILVDGGWSWNDDPTNPPGYFNWAEGEPNVNPDAPSNYVLLKQDDNSGGENPTGTWIVPDSQDDENYYICQSPMCTLHMISCVQIWQVSQKLQPCMMCNTMHFLLYTLAKRNSFSTRVEKLVEKKEY